MKLDWFLLLFLKSISPWHHCPHSGWSSCPELRDDRCQTPQAENKNVETFNKELSLQIRLQIDFLFMLMINESLALSNCPIFIICIGQVIVREQNSQIFESLSMEFLSKYMKIKIIWNLNMRVALNGQSQTSADTSRQTAREVNVIYFTIVISKGKLAIAKLKLLLV